MFHHLRFIEAELEDAKGKLLMHEQEGKLAVEQLREAERKKAEAVRKSMDLEALCQQREKYVTNSWQFCLHKSSSQLDMYTRFYVLWISVTDCSVICFIQRTAATTQAATGDGSGTQKKGTAKQFCSGWERTSLCEYWIYQL